jgi:hypothetical protein
VDFLRSRLLQKERDRMLAAFGGPLIPRNEIHAEVACDLGRHSHADPGDVRRRGRDLERVKIEPDVSCRDEDRRFLAGFLEHLLVSWDLEIREHLVESSRRESVHRRHRQEHFPERRVHWEAAAFATPMKHQSLATLQPFEKRLAVAPQAIAPRLHKKSDRTPAGPQAARPGIGSDKHIRPAGELRKPPSPKPSPRRGMNEISQVRGHRKQHTSHDFGEGLLVGKR